MISSEQFFEELRGALKHLYDPYYLQRSLLPAWFGLKEDPDQIPSLQRILREAIEKLEPTPGSVFSLQQQRIYDLLMYRYVQQFSQEEVASQLGMSVRQLRREQNTAVYALAASLWKDYQPGSRSFDMNLENAPDLKLNETEEIEEDGLSAYRSEGPAPTIQLSPLIHSTVDMLRQLADQKGTRLNVDLPEALPEAVIEPSALRQILLILLNHLIHKSKRAAVSITARVSLGMAELQVSCSDWTEAGLQELPTESNNIELAYKLSELCGAKLTVQFNAANPHASILIPAASRYEVVLIDDNSDLLRLVKRFTTGTQYHVTGLQDPVQAAAVVEERSPSLVLLDVMMPKMDGWEILGRLRLHPNTGKIPVIVCSVLAQDALAASLGASGFIHKPVTRLNLLSELDRHAGLLARESR